MVPSLSGVGTSGGEGQVVVSRDVIVEPAINVCHVLDSHLDPVRNICQNCRVRNRCVGENVPVKGGENARTCA